MSPRPESLGYSVYLTSFERQREELEAGSGSGAAVQRKVKKEKRMSAIQVK